MTKIGRELGAGVVLLFFFVAAIQNGRAIAYRANPRVGGLTVWVRTSERGLLNNVLNSAYSRHDLIAYLKRTPG